MMALMVFEQIIVLVMDGVGIGAAPDADQFGSANADTVGHIVHSENPDLPNLKEMGLYHVANLPSPDQPPAARSFRLQEISPSMDSIVGHWELMGVRTHEPFPTYPNGFPEDVVEAFREATGYGLIGNCPESGMVIIEDQLDEHQRTGDPIVYTSADSVFQVAAHTDVIAVDELYKICQTARREVLAGEHRVGRVIARPFQGKQGNLTRINEKRRDYTAPPPPTVLNTLQDNSITTVGIGKINDLFAGKGLDETHKTRSNLEGMELTRMQDRHGLVLTNLVDFDQEYGHRRDVEGFAKALERFDGALGALRSDLTGSDLLIVTADHGNDPTVESTDHSREHVPALLESPQFAGLCEPLPRLGFDHVGATVLSGFALPDYLAAPSLLSQSI